MANVSDAVGVIRLEGDWDDKDVAVLGYMFAVHSIGNYTTQLDFARYEELYHEVKHNKGINDYEVGFFAAGRWAYYTNVERFVDWAKEANIQPIWKHTQETIPKTFPKLTLEQYMHSIDVLLDRMHTENLKISWDYWDMDTGMDFIVYVITEAYAVRDEEGTLKWAQSENVIESYSANLYNYVNYYDGGTGTDMINYIAANIHDLYPNLNVTDIFSAIVQHPDYHGLCPYPYYDTIDELPDSLNDALQALSGTTT